MARLILTFETLHKVLAAEKALRGDEARSFRCRPTPTPPGLSESICGMSIEVLELERKEELLTFLQQQGLSPTGVHEV